MYASIQYHLHKLEAEVYHLISWLDWPPDSDSAPKSILRTRLQTPNSTLGSAPDSGRSSLVESGLVESRPAESTRVESSIVESSLESSWVRIRVLSQLRTPKRLPTQDCTLDSGFDSGNRTSLRTSGSTPDSVLWTPDSGLDAGPLTQLRTPESTPDSWFNSGLTPDSALHWIPGLSPY